MAGPACRQCYKGFGLTMFSDFELPELRAIKESEGSVDIVIERGELDSDGFIEGQASFSVHGGVVRLQVPDVAVYWIEPNKIVVSPVQGVEEDRIRLYLLGSCLGSVLLQRGVLPLHGSAVAIDGKAYAFVGESGAGKSTLATAFMQYGHSLISDDVIAVQITGDGPLVIPAYPQQKLWQDSLQGLGMDPGLYRPLVLRGTKYSIPAVEQFCEEHLPLAGIFEIILMENGDINIQSIGGLERLQTVHAHTYRKKLLVPLGLMEWHFQASNKLIDHAQIYRVTRSDDIFSPHRLAALILNTLQVGRHEQDEANRTVFHGSSFRSR
jgi:hypothetical protein